MNNFFQLPLLAVIHVVFIVLVVPPVLVVPLVPLDLLSVRLPFLLSPLSPSCHPTLPPAKNLNPVRFLSHNFTPRSHSLFSIARPVGFSLSISPRHLDSPRAR
jgi:hypothetical protein